MKHSILMGTGLALGALGSLALSVQAVAQGAPPAGFVPPPPVAAPLWGEDVPFVQTNPVIYANLGTGGHGSFTGVLNAGTNQLCYMLETPGLDDTTMAHIHLGGPGENGKPVVTLKAPAGGSTGGCVPVAADLAKELLANPGGYYVNVHTKAAPAGWVRGQLETKKG